MPTSTLRKAKPVLTVQSSPLRCMCARCVAHCMLHCGALHRRQQQQDLSDLVELATLTGTGRPMTFAEVR